MALTECGPQHIILYNFIFIYSNTYSFDGGWWRLDGWWSRGPSTSKDLSFAICSRSMLAMPLSVSGGGGSSPHNVWLDIMFVLNLNKIVQIENEQCRIFFFLFHHLITPNVNEWKLPGNSRQKFYNITDFVPLLQSVWMRRSVSEVCEPLSQSLAKTGCLHFHRWQLRSKYSKKLKINKMLLDLNK